MPLKSCLLAHSHLNALWSEHGLALGVPMATLIPSFFGEDFRILTLGKGKTDISRVVLFFPAGVV